MSDFLAQLKSKPTPFQSDGFTVLLRPITFDERQTLLAWMETNKDAPNKGMELERKLVALALCDEAGKSILTEADVGGLDPDKVDAIAFEVGERSGLYKRPDGKKALPPSGSTSPETSSLATSPAPPG